jgi:hypothetical protein
MGLLLLLLWLLWLWLWALIGQPAAVSANHCTAGEEEEEEEGVVYERCLFGTVVGVGVD